MTKRRAPGIGETVSRNGKHCLSRRESDRLRNKHGLAGQVLGSAPATANAVLRPAGDNPGLPTRAIHPCHAGEPHEKENGGCPWTETWKLEYGRRGSTLPKRFHPRVPRRCLLRIGQLETLVFQVSRSKPASGFEPLTPSLRVRHRLFQPIAGCLFRPPNPHFHRLSGARPLSTAAT